MNPNALNLDPGTSSLLSMEQVYSEISIGNIQLPQFQRSYKWSKIEKENLLFSLLQSITIGSIILWCKEDPNGNSSEPKKQIGKFPTSPNPNYLLLDGQQRFTFLTMLYFNGKLNLYADDIPEYFLNIDTEPAIISSAYTEKNNYGKARPRIMNSDAISIQRLIYCSENEIATIPNINAENKLKLSNLKNSLTTSKIPCYYFISSRSKALFVYESANMTGKRLKKEDLMEAILTNLNDDLYKKVNDLIIINKNKFPKLVIISKTNIYRLISAEIFNTYEAKPKNLGVFKSTKPDGNILKKNDIDDAYNKCKRSVEEIINNLKDELKRSSGENLLLPVMIVSVLIYNKYILELRANEIQRGKWARWFILANKNKHYTGGSTNNKVDEEILIIKNSSNINEIWEKLDDCILRSKSNNKDVLKFNWNDFGQLDNITNKDKIYSGKIKPIAHESILWMLKIVTFSSPTKDWFTSLNITNDTFEVHHIWPKESFKKANCNFYGHLINHPANLALITKTSNRFIRGTSFEKYSKSLEHKQNELFVQKVHLPSKIKNRGLNKNDDTFYAYCRERSQKLMDLFNETLVAFENGNLHFAQKSKFEDDINKGEGQHIEFKETLIWDIKQNRVNEDLTLEILKTVNAFGNSQGGCLYIGVNDGGKIVGLSNDLQKSFLGDSDKMERTLVNLVKRASGKSTICRQPFIIHKHNLQPQQDFIFCVEVLPFDNNNSYVQFSNKERKILNLSKGQNLYYQRQGATSQKTMSII